METYTCFGCSVQKNLDQFYAEVSKRGHTKYCMDCLKKIKKEYYHKNYEKIKESHKKYQPRKVVVNRILVEKNREKYNKQNSDFYYNHREKLIQYAREHRKLYPEKEKAHNITKNAIRSGRIIKPESCAICHKVCKVQAHHEDYSKPLEIIWLCRSCHGLVHRDYFKEYAKLIKTL